MRDFCVSRFIICYFFLVCVRWFYTLCSHQIYSVIHECEAFIMNLPLVTHKFHFLCNTSNSIDCIHSTPVSLSLYIYLPRFLLLVSVVRNARQKKHLNMHKLYACVDVIITQADGESIHTIFARLANFELRSHMSKYNRLSVNVIKLLIKKICYSEAGKQQNEGSAFGCSDK